MNNTPTTYDMREAADLVGLGRQRLYNLLRECKVIKPKPSNLPYEKYIREGYFRLHTSSFLNTTTGKLVARNKPLVTPLGIEFITALLNDYLPENENHKQRKSA